VWGEDAPISSEECLQHFQVELPPGDGGELEQRLSLFGHAFQPAMDNLQDAAHQDQTRQHHPADDWSRDWARYCVSCV
jgi:hypothetical protein